MKIIDEKSIVNVTWEDRHKLEMSEAKAFIESRAHVAELEKNTDYSDWTQRENYQRAFGLVAGRNERANYVIRRCKGRIIAIWTKWKEVTTK